MNESILFMLALIKSAVTGEKYPAAGENINWELIINTAKHHNISNIVSYAVLNGGYSVPENVIKTLKKHMYTEIMLDEAQKKEAQQIFDAFEKKELDYMPVKGVLLKKMYPSTDMRRMSDIDILIKKERYPEYEIAMHELGYDFIRESKNEYVFHKSVVSVELHRYLITPGNDDMFSYYETGWQLAQKCGKDGFRYQLKNEDELVYLIAHFAKHYRNAGSGIKPVCDIWLYTKKHPELNMEYAYSQLAQMNLLEFAKNVLRLTKVWFENAEPDSLMISMSNYIFASGEYGITSNRAAAGSIRADMSRKGTFSERAGIYLKLIFLDFKGMKIKYPILEKLPVLLPFCWVHRIFSTLLHKRNKITEHVGMVENKFGDNVDKFDKHIQAVGLDIYNGRKSE